MLLSPGLKPSGAVGSLGPNLGVGHLLGVGAAAPLRLLAVGFGGGGGRFWTLLARPEYSTPGLGVVCFSLLKSFLCVSLLDL